MRTPLLSRSLAAVCSSLTPLLPADPRIGSLGFLPKKRSQRLRGKGACLAATARAGLAAVAPAPYATLSFLQCTRTPAVHRVAAVARRSAPRAGPVCSDSACVAANLP